MAFSGDNLLTNKNIFILIKFAIQGFVSPESPLHAVISYWWPGALKKIFSNETLLLKAVFLNMRNAGKPWRRR